MCVSEPHWHQSHVPKAGEGQRAALCSGGTSSASLAMLCRLPTGGAVRVATVFSSPWWGPRAAGDAGLGARTVPGACGGLMSVPSLVAFPSERQHCLHRDALSSPSYFASQCETNLQLFTDQFLLLT